MPRPLDYGSRPSKPACVGSTPTRGARLGGFMEEVCEKHDYIHTGYWRCNFCGLREAQHSCITCADTYYVMEDDTESESISRRVEEIYFCTNNIGCTERILKYKGR